MICDKCGKEAKYFLYKGDKITEKLCIQCLIDKNKYKNL